MWQNFSTGTACGACVKYQGWYKSKEISQVNINSITKDDNNKQYYIQLFSVPGDRVLIVLWYKDGYGECHPNAMIWKDVVCRILLLVLILWANRSISVSKSFIPISMMLQANQSIASTFAMSRLQMRACSGPMRWGKH